MPFLDPMTLDAIEQDLAAAHQSLAHGGFDIKRGLVGQTKSAPARAGLTVLEVAVPAAGFSYLNARSAGGEMKIGPVPVDVGVGLALTALAAFDVFGDWSDDALNVGMGALASYGARTGAAFGAAAAAAAPATKTSGIGPALFRREHHHVSGALGSGYQEISGAGVGSPVPAGTQRFVVQQIG